MQWSLLQHDIIFFYQPSHLYDHVLQSFNQTHKLYTLVMGAIIATKYVTLVTEEITKYVI